jgi:hypothetical protein
MQRPGTSEQGLWNRGQEPGICILANDPIRNEFGRKGIRQNKKEQQNPEANAARKSPQSAQGLAVPYF